MTGTQYQSLERAVQNCEKELRFSKARLDQAVGTLYEAREALTDNNSRKRKPVPHKTQSVGEMMVHLVGEIDSLRNIIDMNTKNVQQLQNIVGLMQEQLCLNTHSTTQMISLLETIRHTFPKDSPQKHLITSTTPQARPVHRQTSPSEDFVGRRIQVYWPGERDWFFGQVESFDANSQTHQIVYDDGDEEQLDLSKEKYIWV